MAVNGWRRRTTLGVVLLSLWSVSLATLEETDDYNGHDTRHILISMNECKKRLG